ncbi:MAG TPA: hypothetical protein VLM40_02745 [Gemmata sp.]|nr:hypothetical protein [Gemmata sp.]
MITRPNARGAVLSGIAIFAAASFALNWRLDSSLGPRDPRGWHAEQRLKAELAVAPERPFVAVLGTSRTELLDLDLAGLGEGPTSPLLLNMGRPYDGPVMQQIQLRRLIAAHFRPHAVLIEFLPGSVCDAPLPDKAIPPWWLSLREARIQARYCDSPAAWWFEWRSARAAGWHTYRKVIGQATAGAGVDDEPDERRKGPVTDDRRTRGLAFARAQYETVLADWQVHPLWDRATRDLFDYCRDNSIPFAIYTMPESPAFRGWYGPGVRDRIRRYLAAFGSEFHAPVFDCMDWFEEEEDFVDGHHLTQPNAAKFCRRFGREYVKPWLATLPAAK